MKLHFPEPVAADELPWASVSSAHAPWRANALMRLAIAEVAALAAILTGAYQASQNVTTKSATSWLVLSIGGLIGVGVASVVWIGSARSAVAARAARLHDAAAKCAVEVAGVAHVGPTIDATAIVHVAGTKRFHRADCALVAGRKATKGSSAAFTKRGYEPCEVCQP